MHWLQGPFGHLAQRRRAATCCWMTLPSEVDKKLLYTVRSSVVQGFQLGCREGRVYLRCTHPKWQVVPPHRRVHRPAASAPRWRADYSRSAPRCLLCVYNGCEPVCRVDITSPAHCVTAIYNVISRRGGMIVKEVPTAGTRL